MTPDSKSRRRMLRYLGPAFIASVAYLDPGNYATNLEGGARYGYLLVWVVFASNAMAMVVQTLSAKLGIATGKNLAELCRDVYPRPLVWFLWGIMEIVAMATDLAEFLGAAVAFVLLFGMPMWLAGILVLFCTFALLAVERIGFRHFEAVITVFVGVIAACYLIEVLKASPAWDKVLANTIKPSFAGTNSVLLAAGILGATVMPHAIFLHSALTQNRIRPASEEHRRVIFRFEIIDVILAMGIAGLVNAAMLIVAARTFHERGLTNVNAIEDAYLTLQPLLGRAAGVLFAVSLLASGLSSSAVGTMAGQIIMQGFLRRHIPVWLRRLITVTPAMVAIMLGLEPTRLLVLSQVVLSFGLPFAIVPLVHFSMRRDLMGVLVNRISTTIIAWIIAMLIIALNLYLLYKTVTGS